MLTVSQIIVSLLVSALLSGALGLERELRHKHAGIRTNILVGLGSTLVMLVSTHFQIDPARIASGVITGIGFLGGGLIIQSRGHVRGITTATTIWIVSAVGLASGVGLYLPALYTTVIALVVLYLFSDERMEKLRKKY